MRQPATAARATQSRRARRETTPSTPVGDQDRADGDQPDPEPVPGGKAFSEKENPEYRHKKDAQLVDWRDPRRVAELERPEITQPRYAGCHTGKPEENICAPGERTGGCHSRLTA